MKVTVTYETIPPDNSGTHKLELRDASAEADTYESAYAELQGQTREGERIIAVRVP